MGGSENLPIGPGIWGFVAFFVLAIALWLLVRNMNSRLRRMAYRDRERADESATPRPADGDDHTTVQPAGGGPDGLGGTGRTGHTSSSGSTSGSGSTDAAPESDGPTDGGPAPRV